MEKNTKINELLYIAMTTALIMLCGLISVPFGAISLTLQLFGIYFALFFLGGRRATACVLLYLIIGSIGLPVFSGFRGGVSMLFSATGGYLFGFLFSSLLFWFLEVVIGKNNLARLTSSVASLLLLYAIGSAWYSVIYLGGIENILAAILSTVLPFMMLDAVKIILAYIVSQRISLYIAVK